MGTAIFGTAGEGVMQYAVLIHEKPGADDRLSPAEQQAVSDEYLAIREDPRIVDGVRLEPVEMTTTGSRDF
jgi:hypothetical protein